MISDPVALEDGCRVAMIIPSSEWHLPASAQGVAALTAEPGHQGPSMRNTARAGARAVFADLKAVSGIEVDVPDPGVVDAIGDRAGVDLAQVGEVHLADHDPARVRVVVGHKGDVPVGAGTVEPRLEDDH